LKLAPSVGLQAELQPILGGLASALRAGPSPDVLLFLKSCSVYQILVTRPFLTAKRDSKGATYIASAHDE